MQRSSICLILCLSALFGCGGEPPAPAPSAPAEAPAPKPAAATPAPDTDSASNPCSNPGKQVLEVEAGITLQTPWGLEMRYAIDDDKKRGPGYMFLLTHGTRRWQTRRDDTNWNSELTWRGFCWRGGPRPEKHASKLLIEMAPVCKDGKLVELGGCADALGGPS